MIVAGIGSRKGVSAAEVVAAVEAALKEHGLERGQLAALATTEFKKDEAGIFEAGKMMGLEVIVVEIPSPLTPPHKGEGNPSGAGSTQAQRGLAQKRGVAESPSPLWGGVRGGGDDAITSGDLSSPGTPNSDTSARRAPPPSVPPLKGEGGVSAEPVSPPLRRGPSDLDTFPPEGGEERSLSFAVAGVESVSEAAALAAEGKGARLAGPRIAVGRVTCAIAFGGGR